MLSYLCERVSTKYIQGIELLKINIRLKFHVLFAVPTVRCVYLSFPPTAIQADTVFPNEKKKK